MPSSIHVGDQGETMAVTKRGGNEILTCCARIKSHHILGEHTVLSRLQELLPNSPQIPIHTARPNGTAESQNVVPQQSPKKKSSTEPKLKVRILTWNMHDSLPKVGFYYPVPWTVPTHTIGRVGRAFGKSSYVSQSDSTIRIFS